MGSADWMPRNLDKRVEIIFPVEDESAMAKAKHILDVQLKDNKKAYVLKSDGEYAHKDKRGKTLVGAQETFSEEAKRQDEKKKKEWRGITFTPVFAPGNMDAE